MCKSGHSACGHTTVKFSICNSIGNLHRIVLLVVLFVAQW